MSNDHSHWGTESELSFLERLGRWTDLGFKREELLTGYLAGIAARTQWVGMDRWKIKELAQHELDKIGRK